LRINFSDESDELRLSGGDEFVAEAFELRIVSRGDDGADEQGAAHALATAADEGAGAMGLGAMAADSKAKWVC
jgi:hypothetical protein